MKRFIQAVLIPVVLTVALIGLGAAEAAAEECEGVTMPDTLTVAGETLELNGMGVREATIFSINVYVAGLYVTRKSGNGDFLAGRDAPKRLVLQFVRDVDRSQITDAYRESFKKVAGKQYSEHKSKVDRLLGWMKATKDGQSHVYTYTPDDGLVIEVRGEERGSIKGKEFAELFFKIWLGADPPNEGLKRGLLGGACG